MKYRIFTTSEKAWVPMLEDIKKARESIYFEMYILYDDLAGSQFFRELSLAAERGVRVVIILDIVGSYDILSNAVGRLKASGAEVFFSSFLFRRSHRKILIIDETVAFIGGVNVGKKYALWNDLQIRVTGQVVLTILQSFIKMYEQCGGRDQLSHNKLRHGVLKKTKLWFLAHGIGKRQHIFRKYYEERLNNAKKSIVFVTPYLFPPRWFIASIHQALIRGVDVEILLPGSTDLWIVNGINRSFALCLTNLGAKIYFTSGMNHAKTMVVDRREGIIGSQNLDLISFNWNIEAGVFFNEPDMVRDLLVIIEDWKGSAKLFNSKIYGIFFLWYDIPMAFFLRLFGFLPLE
ncbi:MAG: phosphatidylserine/phosphatidylglycerophosphate/cardiolipin synthase family protein [bacterium]|nr:phosphatidylserine/phosphatidylglycerophosphate/cardiolipin synthase family protein [bacterium]